MDLKEWKKLAEQEVYRYRDNQAYVRGVLDGGGSSDNIKLKQRARWVLAVDYVKEYLKRTDPQKAAVFSQLFGLDRPLRRVEERRSIVSLSMERNISPTTLYKWKSEMLSLVLLAAAQTGALRLYSID